MTVTLPAHHGGGNRSGPAPSRLRSSCTGATGLPSAPPRNSIFTVTRDVLRRCGPDVAEPKLSGQYNFTYLALTILNSGIRPLLTRWHPALTGWEAHRPAGASTLDHEQAWPRADDLRAELETARQTLTDYTAALATACGIPNLLDTIPTPP